MCGFCLRNIPVINVATNINPSWSSALRSIALSVILVKAGLDLDPTVPAMTCSIGGKFNWLSPTSGSEKNERCLLSAYVGSLHCRNGDMCCDVKSLVGISVGMGHSAWVNFFISF